MGAADRVVRLTLGMGVMYLVAFHPHIINDSILNWMVGVFGFLNVVSASVRVCPAYLIANISTLPKAASRVLGKAGAHYDGVVGGGSASVITSGSQESECQARSTALLRRKLQFSVVIPMIALLVIFGTIVIDLNHQYALTELTRKVDVAADVAARVQLATEQESHDNLANPENEYLAGMLIRDSLEQATIFFLHDSAGNILSSDFAKGLGQVSIVAAVSKFHEGGGDSDVNFQRGMQLVDGQEYIWSSTRVGASQRWFTVVMLAPGHYTLSSYLLTPSFLVIILAVTWMSIWTSAYIVRKFVNKVEENSLMLQHRALHDSLTGLPNRQKLNQLMLDRMAQLDTDGQRLLVLLIDLIDFRDINDTLGHAFGDQLLVLIAANLSELDVEHVDVVRMEGDVFCLLWRESLENIDTISLADLVREKLQRSHDLNGIPVAVQIRMGISSFPENSDQPQELIRFADIALAKAKNQRIKQCFYQSEHDNHSLRKLTLRARLKAAIEHNHLTLVYQPKVDIHYHRLVGVEALVRWNDAEYGAISPVEFVSWAEQAGLIDRLTRWVLITAEKQSREWQRQGHFIPIAVNISPSNLNDAKLIPLISELVSGGGFAASMLELEITENAVMEDPEQALKKMEELCDLGVTFAIDDFGTGLSSFSYLRKLPISNLKIDRAFILEGNQSDKDAVILQSMISLGKGLGCVVTAEGVEDQQSLERLQSLGCDHIQGFHVCRPVPAEQLMTWMDTSGWMSLKRAA